MSTCSMHNVLSFIRDTISNRVTSSNLTLSSSQKSSSQSQSPISPAPISVSPTPSSINTVIQNNDDSNNFMGHFEKELLPEKIASVICITNDDLFGKQYQGLPFLAS